jgi:hypothetical protein
VKLVVELEEVLHIVPFGALLHLSVEVFESFYVLCGELVAGGLGRKAFQKALDAVELAYVLVGYRAYNGAFSRRDRYEALAFELPEGLPDGSAAYAEALGYLLLQGLFRRASSGPRRPNPL